MSRYLLLVAAILAVGFLPGVLDAPCSTGQCLEAVQATSCQPENCCLVPSCYLESREAVPGHLERRHYRTPLRNLLIGRYRFVPEMPQIWRNRT